ncbi:MAG: septal ring lytic transglycosylase RlpA family protein [Bacteroidota bacterium]
MNSFRCHFLFLMLVVSQLLLASKTYAQLDSSAIGSVYSERGKASFYAHKFNGRRTTSGEIYSRKKLTAAHRTLPFGTKVKVTNVETNKWVIVTINDRGPRSKKRIIDLSWKAAKRIGMSTTVGVVEVIVEQVPLIKSPDDTFRKHEVE